jgi:hypothetical protein
MMRIIQSYPQLMQIAGDLIVGNMDFKDADKLARRLAKTIPPGIKEVNPDEPPAPAPVPSPQQQLLLQKAQTEQIRQQKEQVKTQVELIKLYKETKETDDAIRQEIL